MFKSVKLIRSVVSCTSLTRTFWTGSRSLCSNKPIPDQEISGSVATKFKIFSNSDSGVIYDIEEERSQIENTTDDVEKERSSKYDINTESIVSKSYLITHFIKF